MEQTLIEKWLKTRIPNTDIGKYISDEIVDFFIAQRHTELSALMEEIEKMKKGKKEGEDKEWAIHYQGYDEGVADVLSLLSAKLKQ